MGVNGQKLNFQANGGRWQGNGVETAWNSFLPVYIFAIGSSGDIFVNKSGGGIKGLTKSRRKWGYWPKIEFSGNWLEKAGQRGGNSLELLSLCIYYCNSIKGSPISRHKWG